MMRERILYVEFKVKDPNLRYSNWLSFSTVRQIKLVFVMLRNFRCRIELYSPVHIGVEDSTRRSLLVWG